MENRNKYAYIYKYYSAIIIMLLKKKMCMS